MNTDPISDMLTRIRNALRARHTKLEMPSSRLKMEIAKILKEEGFLSSYKVAEEGRKKLLRITLKYGAGGEPAISHLVRVSRPGRRVYSGHARIPRVLGGLGHSILTTPRGLMTGSRARKANVGGEVLLEVW
jgi:small subunit ribosomal protein S8